MPFDSARIQICKEALVDQTQRQANLYIQMTMALMQNLKAEIVYRIDVDFQVPKNQAVESWLGRTVHVKMLESKQFFEVFVSRYRCLFD